MNPVKIVALLLIVFGAVGLAWGGFTYTSERHTTDIGPVHIQVNEKERVNIPLWAGLGSLAVGVVLLLSRRTS
jgi:TRAP-type C4-dicarboxylate transport system permease small subunit